MRWPWTKAVPADPVMIAWWGTELAWLQAGKTPDGHARVLRFGVERDAEGSIASLSRRLQDLQLKGLPVRVMLRPAQYQILQIESPAVPPDELRAAARWKIRDMVDQHLDDLTLDVMRVGDAQVRPPGNLFVVVTANTVVRSILELADAMQWTVEAIDIQETALRNLQSAAARDENRVAQAHAALVLLDDGLALFNVTANEELFYTRRIELGAVSVGLAAAPVRAPPANPFSTPAATVDPSQRFLIELQRSLDLWDRTWPLLPLDEVSVHAGDRTAELVQWLQGEFAMPFKAFNPRATVAGFDGGTAADRTLCWPLLGTLMRSSERRL